MSRRIKSADRSTRSKDRLKFDLQPGARGDCGQKIRDIFLAESGKTGSPRRSRALLGEGGIDAGQRDEISQEFFGARHAPRV